jgi:hypothetical protein
MSTMNDILEDIHFTFSKMYADMSVYECREIFVRFLNTPATLLDLGIFHVYQKKQFKAFRKMYSDHDQRYNSLVQELTENASPKTEFTQ